MSRGGDRFLSGFGLGRPTFLYYDGHGNLAAEANTSGSQTANHTYDPFGGPIDSVPSNQTIHRFVGRWDKQYDTATGLILMGARPYDPTTGRFLAVDPVPGGSLNNYDYAKQDAIDNYDLDGKKTYGDGGWDVFSPYNNVCDMLNFNPNGTYRVYGASGKLWTVCRNVGWALPTYDFHWKSCLSGAGLRLSEWSMRTYFVALAKAALSRPYKFSPWGAVLSTTLGCLENAGNK